MPRFPECAICGEIMITEDDYFETKVNLRVRDGSEVKGNVPTHVHHGVNDHIEAVGKFLRPYLVMSADEGPARTKKDEKKGKGT